MKRFAAVHNFQVGPLRHKARRGDLAASCVGADNAGAPELGGGQDC
jgi:hypothetical protein